MAKAGAHHVSHGPAPSSFKTWCVAAGKKGCRKFRVTIDGKKEPVMVAYSSGAGSARVIEKMGATWVEAIDDEGSILRTWEFKPSDDPEPGYVKEEGDNEDERLLKTFAHLLADAYRLSIRELREVVNIQAQGHQEERKSMTTLRILNEKLMAALAKQRRVRVADIGEEDEAPEAEGSDNFLQELLAPVLQNMVQKAARRGASEVAQTVLGEEAKPANGAKE